MNEKKQRIVCHKGRCMERGESQPSHFDVLFDDKTIRGKIEKDLLMANLYGV